MALTRLLAVALNATEAQVAFALAAGRFENYQPVLSGSVLTTLREMERLHFATEGDVFGNAWAPLAPSTVKQRERQGYGGEHPILIRTARLAKSLTQRGGDAIAKSSRFGLVFGTKVEYARYHQQPQNGRGLAGAIRRAARSAFGGGGSLPQRQVIPDPLPGAVLDEVRLNIRDWLIEGRIRKADA